MNIKKLSNYTNQQIKNLLIIDVDVEPYVEKALERAKNCFKKVNNKYYKKDESNFFIYHTGKYCIYLYYLSNTVYRMGNEELAEKIYYLNKILHSIDWFYAIELPAYFGVEHPLASVLGRAKYSNGFFVYQGCTVGGNKSKYPVIGENVIMYANSSILGDSHIGNNVLISTGAIIKDEIITDNCIVYGQSPNLIIKKNKNIFISEQIAKIWKI